ncbi:HET-domain-containing protein [Hypoxylon sp. FL1150]|nr:HET-domain-containing protein [Hypoxylon sp. FL1150]
MTMNAVVGRMVLSRNLRSSHTTAAIAIANRNPSANMSEENGLNLSNIESTRATLPCSHCAAIVPDRNKVNVDTIDTTYERIDTYPEFPGLRSSAEAGCHLCGLLQRCLSTQASLDMDQGNTPPTELPSSSHHPARNLHVRINIQLSFISFTPVSGGGRFILEGFPPQYNGVVNTMSVRYKPVAGPLKRKDGSAWGARFEFGIFDSPDLLAPKLERRRRPPSLSSLSDENIELMQRWIHECRSKHSKCLGSGRWLPTRLLEINYDGNNLDLRLVETSKESLDEESPFAALSHMWGNMKENPPLRTMSFNYYRLTELIPGKDLPRNFLDAALVCARLGIRYLWIDSLCIVQDSAEDWRHEAALMHLVYRHALVTIVATSATSCHDGFLQRSIDKVPAAKMAYTIRYQKQEGEAEKQHNQYLIAYHYENVEDNYRMFLINSSEWNTRGWTMQERSLSTRSIHFCRNRIFFECRGCLGSEDNDPAQESDLINDPLWPRSTTMSFDELYQHWQLFLAMYCDRNLTVATDKLPAIQSVAAEMATAAKCEYIPYAGLWRHNLRRELLWNPSSFDTATRPTQWRAPSWSWASIEGDINFWQRSFRSAASSATGSLFFRLARHPLEVLDTDVAYPNPESATRGFVKLKVLVKRVDKIHRCQESLPKREFFPYNLSTTIEGSSQAFAHGKLDVDDEEKAVRDDSSSLVYMHVNEDTRATGLLLREVPQATDTKITSGELLWRRVGIATLFVDRSEPAIMEESFSDDDNATTVMLI